MIRALLSVGGPEAKRALRRNLGGLVAEGVLLGVGFALLVPLFRMLLGGAVDAGWVWLAAMAGVLAIYAVMRYRTQLAGYRAAIGLAANLYERLGDHIARLPLGWFEAERVGSVGRLTSQGVIDVMGVPAHLLRPVVTAVVTPATVIALMFLFDWRLALAALITAPVAALVYRWLGDLVQRTDATAPTRRRPRRPAVSSNTRRHKRCCGRSVARRRAFASSRTPCASSATRRGHSSSPQRRVSPSSFSSPNSRSPSCSCSERAWRSAGGSTRRSCWRCWCWACAMSNR